MIHNIKWKNNTYTIESQRNLPDWTTSSKLVTPGNSCGEECPRAELGLFDWGSFWRLRTSPFFTEAGECVSLPTTNQQCLLSYLHDVYSNYIKYTVENLLSGLATGNPAFWSLPSPLQDASYPLAAAVVARVSWQWFTRY